MKINKKTYFNFYCVIGCVSNCRSTTNFETSQKDYQEYAKLASSAESLIYSDPRSSLTVFGTFGEQLTKEGIA